MIESIKTLEGEVAHVQKVYFDLWQKLRKVPVIPFKVSGPKRVLQMVKWNIANLS